MATEPDHRYTATPVSVVDGDTFWARVDVGFRIELTVDLRLRGVDAPELATPEGVKARTYVRSVLFPGGTAVPLRVRTYKNTQGAQDRSGQRWIADVYLQTEVGWTSLAEMLVENGHTKETP